MSFAVALLIDGVDVKIHVDEHNDIAISIDNAEASHFNRANILLLIATLAAAENCVREEEPK
jgi:hypothetical protein